MADELAPPDGVDVPDTWGSWCKTLFPKTFSSDFARHHAEFWDWVESLENGIPPENPAFASFWPRGGGKTTNAETAVIYIGAKKKRNFCLYVRATQAKANESVQSIATKLESSVVEHYHPTLAQRAVGRYGHSKGWRMDMLRCANGFIVLALGLDSSSRGVKIEDFRPDMIFLDDIDDREDSKVMVEKKERLLTSAILPAGSTDVAVCFVQNLIHENSIANKINTGKAEYLANIKISGPYKAIEGLVTESYKEADERGIIKTKYRILEGTPLWSGQDLATCQRQMNLWGFSVFKRESQHEVKVTGGIWDHIEFTHVTYEHVMHYMILGQVWVDPAVTSTDKSDNHAIVAGCLLNDKDKTICMTYFWEKITTPLDSIKRAILKAIEWRFRFVGIETDQGGDTWKSVYNEAWRAIVEDDDIAHVIHKDVALERGIIDEDTHKACKGHGAMVFYDETDDWEWMKRPLMRQAKAGSGVGSKMHRNSKMLTDYERGRVVHMIGTHEAGESALVRFPNKPLDLADVMFWLWFKLSKLRTESRIG